MVRHLVFVLTHRELAALDETREQSADGSSIYGLFSTLTLPSFSTLGMQRGV
jgi:hypothetical protein